MVATKMPLSVVEHRQRPEQRFSSEKSVSSIAQICARSQARRPQSTRQHADDLPAVITSHDLRDNRRFAAPVPPYTRGFEDASYEHAYTNPYHPGTIAAGDYDTGFADGRHNLESIL